MKLENLKLFLVLLLASMMGQTGVLNASYGNLQVGIILVALSQGICCVYVAWDMKMSCKKKALKEKEANG